jgi:hypothetical protein
MPNSLVMLLAKRQKRWWAVEPLERTAAWETGEVEETCPSGL